MKRNHIPGLTMLALLLLALGASPALARHPCWDDGHRGQQGDSTLTTEQQASAKKIDDEYGPQVRALRQQILSKRHEYHALLTAETPDSAKIEAVAKEVSTLNQSLDELLVKRDVALVQAGVPHGPGMGYDECDDRGRGYHRGAIGVDYN